MAKFNLNKNSDVISTSEWGKAYTLSLEEKLFTLTVSNFVENTTYLDLDDRLIEIRELVRQLSITNIEFILGLIVTLRTKYNMRSMSHLLIGELMLALNTDITSLYNIKKVVSDSIVRVDDITEILSYLLEWKSNKKQRKWILKHSLVKWLKEGFNKFDEYQLSKYNRNKKGTINLKDVVRLLHTKGELSEKILTDNLKTAETWESELSKYSKDDDSNRLNVFHNLLSKKKLWYMATLRNLRNILKLEVSSDEEKAKLYETVKLAINYIVDEKAIKENKQLIFRYYSAYKEVQSDLGWLENRISNDHKKLYKVVLEWLKVACSLSINNLDFISDKENITVFSDVSGSMETSISRNSHLEYIDIALLLAWLVKTKRNDSTVWIFGDIARIFEDSRLKWEISAFSYLETYKEGEVWYSTYGDSTIKLMIEKNIVSDKIFLFTDTEFHDSKFEEVVKEYRKKINSKAKVYLFNLSGSKFKLSKKDYIVTITWWSENVFDILRLYELVDEYNLLNDIKEIGKTYKL